MTSQFRYTRRMGRAALTADELLHLNLPNKRTELVRGALVVREPPGGEHGFVAGRVLVEIGTFVRARRLGIVLAAETGFTLFTDPDTVRAPDAAFIQRDRVPDPLPRAYFTIAPDLAVEVISPRDTAREVNEKVADWLAAGTRLVWCIDPRKRSARVHRVNGSVAFIAADGALDGEDVLPGFAVHLRAILG
jgi:Uma2 family endonuclease